MAKDTKNDFNEKIPEPVVAERTPEKTLGEAKSHEIRPEEKGLPGPTKAKMLGKPALLLAEFDSAAACMHGAEKLRDAGYSSFDAHTPFPVFGMLGLNKLPRHHHPVFFSDRFKAFSDDKFFLSVEAEDPKFDTTRTRT